METKAKLLQPAKKNSKSQSADETPGNIDKVRDILFGGQMRDYERRFSRFEDRLAQETAELKEDLRKRLSALEQFVKQELASVSDRIKAEHDERAAADKDLARDLRENAKTFEKKTSQIDDQIEKLQGELRKQILDLHKRLSDDIQKKVDDVLARLSRTSADLSHGKTDRAALAAVLNEMALRISEDPPAPGTNNGRKG